MILIVTTVDVYLAVYKGVELEETTQEPVRRKWPPGRKAHAGQPAESDAGKQS